jgi:hypothetical protein
MVRFIALVLCAIMGFSAAANGDTITLRKVNKNVELKVIGITDKYIHAVISRKALKSLDIRFFKASEYPDLIFLNVENAVIECKVKGVTGESIQALIPTTAISSLQVSFQADDKQDKIVSVETPQAAIGITSEEKEMTPVEAEVQEPVESEKEGIVENKIVDKMRTDTEERTGKYYQPNTKKTELENLTDKGTLSSIGTGGGETGMPKQKPTSDALGKDRIKPVEEGLKKEKPLDQNLGRVEGKILKGGKPLPNCQVKLLMLEKYGLIIKGYRSIAEAMEFETTTDEEGVYRFVNMAPGLYKLYWKPPSESMWVRRFKMEPDVIIESGKLTNPKDIEILKRTAIGTALH